MMPASRSSMIVLQMFTGGLHVAPPSAERTICTFPHGQTCASRSPEKTASRSPFGARQTEGGTWYPVALAESGRTEDAAEEGTLLYDDGLLEVRFLRAELNDSWIEGYVNADYYLLINNRRAEGVRIRIKDAMLGDAPYVDPAWNDDYIFTENDRIGAQSKGVMIVSPQIPKEETENGLPEFSFLLQVRSQGEDTIFYTTAERIRLAEE